MMEQLLPKDIVVVETGEEPAAVELFPEEEAVARRAVERRRREFMAGRACARAALGQLGIPRCGIPSGVRGEPVWPPGVVGSITHCRGYRACAVARAGRLAAVGIDAEEHAPLPPGILAAIARDPERAWARGPRHGVWMDRLLFSAKEAVYKAWFPLTRRGLGFGDVEVRIEEPGARFAARLLVPAPAVDGRRLTELHGRWRVERGLVLTAVTVGSP